MAVAAAAAAWSSSVQSAERTRDSQVAELTDASGSLSELVFFIGTLVA